MFREERLHRLLALLKEKQQVYVADAAALFDVSESTIRLDLKELEERGLVKRTHGGAIYQEDRQASKIQVPYAQRGLRERLQEHYAEKLAIGRAAAALIRDGETIMIDGGSTTRQVLRNLQAHQHLTIVTHILDIYPDLVGTESNFRIIVTGGELDPKNMMLIGEESPKIVSNYRASKAVLGIDGVSVNMGVTTMDVHASLKKVMIENSGQLIVVADSSKLGRVSLVPVASLKQVDFLVTDDGADPKLVDAFEEQGVKVLVARVDRNVD